MTEMQKQELKNRTNIEMHHMGSGEGQFALCRKIALRKMVAEGAANLSEFEKQHKDLRYMSHETNEIIGKQLLLVSAYIEDYVP